MSKRSKRLEQAADGDKFKCVNKEGWGPHFQIDGVYTVSDVKEHSLRLDGHPVAFCFQDDFEFVE